MPVISVPSTGLKVGIRDLPSPLRFPMNKQMPPRRTVSGRVLQEVSDDFGLPPVPHPIMHYRACYSNGNPILFGGLWGPDETNKLAETPRIPLPSPTKQLFMTSIITDVAPMSLIRHSTYLTHYAPSKLRRHPSTPSRLLNPQESNVFITTTNGTLKYTPQSIIPYRLHRASKPLIFYDHGYHDSQTDTMTKARMHRLPLEIVGLALLPIVLPVDSRFSYMMHFLVVNDIFPLHNPALQESFTASRGGRETRAASGGRFGAIGENAPPPGHNILDEIDIVIDISEIGTGHFWQSDRGLTPIISKLSPRLSFLPPSEVDSPTARIIQITTLGVITAYDSATGTGTINAAAFFAPSSEFNSATNFDLDVNGAEWDILENDPRLVTQFMAFHNGVAEMVRCVMDFGIVASVLVVRVASLAVVKLINALAEFGEVATKTGEWERLEAEDELGWLKTCRVLREVGFKTLRGEYLDMTTRYREDDVAKALQLAKDGRRKMSRKTVFGEDEFWEFVEQAGVRGSRWTGWSSGAKIRELAFKGCAQQGDSEKGVYEIFEADSRVQNWPDFVDLKLTKRVVETVVRRVGEGRGWMDGMQQSMGRDEGSTIEGIERGGMERGPGLRMGRGRRVT